MPPELGLERLQELCIEDLISLAQWGSLVLVMQFLPHTCHSLVSNHLTRSLAPEEELGQLLGPLHFMVRLFGQGTEFGVCIVLSKPSDGSSGRIFANR